MATRSTIAVQHANGTVSQIYAHWDGYLNHNGELLYNNYTQLALVEQLIAFGDLSSLDCTTDDCIFYMRDRNETNCAARTYTDINDYYRNHQSEDYDYLFAGDIWLVKFYLTNDKFILLSNAFTLKDE